MTKQQRFLAGAASALALLAGVLWLAPLLGGLLAIIPVIVVGYLSGPATAIVATAFTIAGEDIPDNVLPESAVALGSVATIPFAFPGTDEVPQSLDPYLEDHKTFLLSHHGAAAMGRDLWDACFRMETLERVAMMLLYAKQLDSIRPMPDSAFDRLLKTALNGSLEPYSS